MEGGKGVVAIAESDGLEQLVADNDIDDIVEAEWKRFFLAALPKLEEHGHDFWKVVKQDPAIAEDFGKELVRAACELIRDGDDEEE